MPQVAVPIFRTPPGSYTTSRVFSLSVVCPTQFAHMAWTSDGTTPVPGGHGNQSGNIFIFNITASGVYTIKAIGYRDGYQNSALVMGTYVITIGPPVPPPRPVSPPVLNPSHGENLTYPFHVNISVVTGGSIIIYTENDDSQNPSWTHGTHDGNVLDLVLTGDTTLRVIAGLGPNEISPMVVGVYTSTPGTLQPPVLAPPGGNNITFPFAVNISTPAPGAIIIYTLNDPTPPSLTHGIQAGASVNLNLTSDTTIMAIAANLTTSQVSGVATGIYSSGGPPPGGFGQGGITVIVSDQDTIFGGVLIQPGFDAPAFGVPPQPPST